MRGLVPRIHDFRVESKAWMAATSAAMTGHRFNLIGKCSKVGESFFEPPGAIHLISENASSTEPAELIAVFVADDGATLTTFIE